MPPGDNQVQGEERHAQTDSTAIFVRVSLPHGIILTALPLMDSQEKQLDKWDKRKAIHIQSEHVDIEKTSWQQRLYYLRIQKKEGLIVLSFVLCFLHFGVLCNDIIAHSVTESFLNWSYFFTVPLLMSHVVSFYWAILGAIYSLQSRIRHLCLLALVSAVLNFWVFLGRTWFELEIIKFREEIY